MSETADAVPTKKIDPVEQDLALASPVGEARVLTPSSYDMLQSLTADWAKPEEQS